MYIVYIDIWALEHNIYSAPYYTILHLINFYFDIIPLRIHIVPVLGGR